MTPRAAIRQIAKMVSQDLAGGAPSRAALEAGEMLAEVGAVPELMACLVAEARKKRPADRSMEAYCFLLETALANLRLADNGGDAKARAGLAEACQAVEAAMTSQELPPLVVMLIARSVTQAGLGVGPALKQAVMTGMESDLPLAPTPSGRSDVGGHLAAIAEAAGQDPFTIFAEMSITGAAFSPEHHAAMAAELAGSPVPALREAALGFLLVAHPAPGIAVLEALQAQASRHPVSSRLVERLVRLRPWLPPTRQAGLDKAIRALRAHAAAPVAAPRRQITTLVASLCDGAGAQSLFAMLKSGRRFALASVLIKTDEGVTDAWVRGDLSKTEAGGILEQIVSATEGVEVPEGFVIARLADALAINLARQAAPPFGLLQVTEALGLGLLQPAAMSPMALSAQLLAGQPPDKTGPKATRDAHVRAADWPEMFETLASWFEAGEAVEAVLRPIPSRGGRIEAVLKQILPARRAFWAERCAWMAATLQASPADEDQEWLNFALVARDLAGGEPLPEISLFRFIANATVDAFDASRPRRRQAGRRGR